MLPSPVWPVATVLAGQLILERQGGEGYLGKRRAPATQRIAKSHTQGEKKCKTEVGERAASDYTSQEKELAS